MELVGYEDDKTRSPSSFSSWVVHIEKPKDLYKGWLLYKEIRANRKERRLIKDELLIVGNVLQEINPSCLQRDRIQRAIDGLYTREYTFRIVDDENINIE